MSAPEPPRCRSSSPTMSPCGSRTRRSTRRSTSRTRSAAARAQRMPADAPCGCRQRAVADEARASSATRSRSVSGRPRSRTGLCPGTGKATSSSGSTAARWGLWSSARPASPCCCTCRERRGLLMPRRDVTPAVGRGTWRARQLLHPDKSWLSPSARRRYPCRAIRPAPAR